MEPVPKQPPPEPGLDPFRDGIAVLRRDGTVAGHLASRVSTLWSPSRPLSWQWSVWMAVVWSNGDRERRIEDYPPWTIVRDLQAGVLVWDEDGPHKGEYTAEWLSGPERHRAHARLGFTDEDF